MRRFLGLTPPPEFSERVSAWQHSLGHHITEPHVTLKAPSGLGDDLGWLPAVERACAHFPALPVTLEGVRTFGRRVIYLAVHSPAITGLHLALLDAVAPAQRLPHEGRHNYTPHLTLVLAWEKLGVSFHEALESARAAFTEPVGFTATEVHLFEKPAPGHPYRRRRSFTLAGPTAAP